MQTNIPRKGLRADVMRRIAICALVLLIGIAAMSAMIALRQPPAEVAREETALRVTVIDARPQDLAVTLTGYGTVQPVEVVAIAPEVAGRVVAVHSELKVGGIIPAGEILFAIDPRDYRTAVDDAQGVVAQLENSMLALEKQHQFDRQRLNTLTRNRELARAEYMRVRALFERDRVGTQSGVDAAEQTYNTIRDQADQLARAIALYPVRIAETRAALQSAEARLEAARNNLARCRVPAPFEGRVTQYAIEVGGFANRGVVAVTLADDRLLEIQVSLDSRDARRWLHFKDDGVPLEGAWFGDLSPVPVAIRWTEDLQGHAWEGRMHRVVRFSEDTRTLTVAVRIAAAGRGNGFPLVQGMFCRVDIPGRTMAGVVPLPRWAVSFENTVYLAVDGRLKTVPVQVARIHGETTYVSSGLGPGDQVIRTRLVDPLENSLLDIAATEEGS